MNTSHHVKMMEVTIDNIYYLEDRIVLFDDRDITPEEMVKCIREDIDNDYFVSFTKEQYKNIFRSLKGE